MASERLNDVGLRFGTDKSSSHHGYLDHYEAHLALRTTKVRSLLEIGVYDGASLRMWGHYFSKAKIVGLDIDPRCLAFSSGNMTVEMCDQSDAAQLTNVGMTHGPFDVIIDDGSHIWSHQILTFEVMFPFLASGGIFIVEDIDTSFGDHAAHYGQDSTMTAAHYVTRLANAVLASTAGNLTQEMDLRVRAFVPLIESVTFIRRSAIIHRR